ncbi:NAD(P)-binding protein [Metschnikowia bicuspidata var. bicuspidata NRRL YB-4993]|uniref:NAD(P)-binding protein n=1 Tax=Metschnikowia bicuspidata var. bicuspidata NRRL YB-4993 TaxID=869754 RepID=A0A1A0HH17_9ASCO|nr:NAD(P)-binding protein [Metschnikowia bicuspidata var. bicuspidata NRRL YB-4993]OBA23143.1 NAD(P)-binding protein [Metschnikowia bicuspidata var. bicuspidata NRRL YB-4993]
MTRPKVLILGDLNTSLPHYKRFLEKFECIHHTLASTREEVIADFHTKFHDISAIYGAWLGFVLVGGFHSDIIEALPPTLKVVSICSVGHDNYNGAQMKEKGVVLTNVPSDGAAEPVADLVLYNALTAFRNFNMSLAFLRPENDHTVAVRAELESCKFDFQTGALVGGLPQGYSFGEYIGGRPCLSPKGHNAVIVGFGNIGQTIGRKLSLIGMNIHYVKRRQLSGAEERSLGFVATYHRSIGATCLFADLVVIACPATPETHHLLNSAVLGSFAKPIRVINIGRGSVIDEQALVDSLKSGKVVFAGLDVYENEPSVHPELYGRQDVFLTPHVGASTTENFDHTAVVAMENIEAVLGGRPALTQVN